MLKRKIKEHQDQAKRKIFDKNEQAHFKKEGSISQSIHSQLSCSQQSEKPRIHKQAISYRGPTINLSLIKIIQSKLRKYGHAFHT